LLLRTNTPYRVSSKKSLADRGFATDILSSGEEALTLFKGGLKNYRVLVTDVSLKGRLKGWDSRETDQGIDPEFPVVYMTGAYADQWASQGVPNSNPSAKTFRASAARHCSFAASKCADAASVKKAAIVNGPVLPILMWWTAPAPGIAVP